METTAGEFTQLLRQVQDGDREAQGRMYDLVYTELRRLAARYLANERRNHTLQPTALVNEACLKLIAQQPVGCTNRNHFFAVAACAMRHILVDYARSRRADKRGAGSQKMQMDDALPPAADGDNAALMISGERLDQIILVSGAIDELAKRYPRQAKVIEMKFFGGLTDKQSADVLGVDLRTSARDACFARAWLGKYLSGE